MRQKLGFLASDDDEHKEKKTAIPSKDEKFFGELFDTMARTHADFTDVFVALSEFADSGSAQDGGNGGEKFLGDKGAVDTLG
jgi:uncharacterized protein YdiU (UPF0061 family)